MSKLRELLESGQRAPFSSLQVPEHFRYRSFESFVAENGGSFEPAALTDAERRYVDLCRLVHEPKPKNCYENSQIVLLRGDLGSRFRYVEGFCREGDFWFLHAWLTLNGKVVDVTRGVFGTWADDREYFGVTFETSFVRAESERTNAFGPLLDNELEFYPLLRGEPWR